MAPSPPRPPENADERDALEGDSVAGVGPAEGPVGANDASPEGGAAAGEATEGDEGAPVQAGGAGSPGDADAGEGGDAPPEQTSAVVREHLRGLLEALLFLSNEPMSVAQLAGLARADRKIVRELLAEVREFYKPRGLRLDEVAGGWLFRTNPAYAPFLRELTGQKPVKMTRAQIETLAIVAYRQPVTRPEVDEIRGVDSGPVLKALLERDLVRIMGKKEEPGRPLLYGTTPQFLHFFGLNSLRDLPTLREFTELTDDSKQAFTRETGEEPPSGDPVESGLAGGEGHLNPPERAASEAEQGEPLETDGQATAPDTEAKGPENNAPAPDVEANVSETESPSPEAEGPASVADGLVSEANRLSSEVDGEASEVDGAASEVDGAASEVDGEALVAEGPASVAGRSASVAEGLASVADRSASVAEGLASVAEGLASVADGLAFEAEGVAPEPETAGPEVAGQASEEETPTPEAIEAVPEEETPTPSPDEGEPLGGGEGGGDGEGDGGRS